MKCNGPDSQGKPETLWICSVEGRDVIINLAAAYAHGLTSLPSYWIPFRHFAAHYIINNYILVHTFHGLFCLCETMLFAGRITSHHTPFVLQSALIQQFFKFEHYNLPNHWAPSSQWIKGCRRLSDVRTQVKLWVIASLYSWLQK